MEDNLSKSFVKYLYNNYVGNFLGFAVGMASTRLVSHFFTTKSIRNLWGIAAKKTVVDRQTFNALEWLISIIIGFLVFEIISKWVRLKIEALIPGLKKTPPSGAAT
jgi:hypothetical protein